MKTIVLGPPGTGKTTTLLNKVDDYLKQTDPDKVGYFAFTQKAAYEARDRAVKKFNLLKDLKLDYYGDLSGGGFLISTPKNAIRCSCGSGFKLL